MYIYTLHVLSDIKGLHRCVKFKGQIGANS